MLMLVTIFVLLMSSNLSVGASVELTAVIGKKTLELPSLFEFTLFETAREMWHAGIYPVFSFWWWFSVESGPMPNLSFC